MQAGSSRARASSSAAWASSRSARPARVREADRARPGRAGRRPVLAERAAASRAAPTAAAVRPVAPSDRGTAADRSRRGQRPRARPARPRPDRRRSASSPARPLAAAVMATRHRATSLATPSKRARARSPGPVVGRQPDERGGASSSPPRGAGAAQPGQDHDAVRAGRGGGRPPRPGCRRPAGTLGQPAQQRPGRGQAAFDLPAASVTVGAAAGRSASPWRRGHRHRGPADRRPAGRDTLAVVPHDTIGCVGRPRCRALRRPGRRRR